MHLSWQLNCRSLRCSWSIACRRCLNYIFILDLIHGFNRLGKNNCKTGRETLKLTPAHKYCHWNLCDYSLCEFGVNVSTQWYNSIDHIRGLINHVKCAWNRLVHWVTAESWNHVIGCFPGIPGNDSGIDGDSLSGMIREWKWTLV